MQPEPYKGIMVVYSITDETSFEEAQELSLFSFCSLFSFLFLLWILSSSNDMISSVAAVSLNDQ